MLRRLTTFHLCGFSRSASVLTHEGCDPMLSASPSGPGGGGGAAGIGIGDEGGVFPGSSAAAGRSSSSSSALQPFSPPELAAATAFFGNTTTSSSSSTPSGTGMSSSSNKLLRLSTASSDSQHSMSASAQGYDLVAANASRISEDGEELLLVYCSGCCCIFATKFSVVASAAGNC